MVEKKLKDQITELRNSIFSDKDKANVAQNKNNNNKLEAANLNSSSNENKINTGPTGIFRDVRSMNKRLEKLEDSFYSYAYDSTKVLTSFHRNVKKLDLLLSELSNKSQISSETIDRIENNLPHTCPLVPKQSGVATIKKKKSIIRYISQFFLLVIIITIAVFLSNLAYEVIYFNLKSILNQTTVL